MKEKSNIFERIEEISKIKGIRGINGLAEALNYASPEKIYRIGRDKKAKPSFEIISDLANKFEDLNLRWFITGNGKPFGNCNDDGSPTPVVKSKSDVLNKDVTECNRLKAENEQLKKVNETYLRIIEALSTSQKGLHATQKGLDAGNDQ